MTELKIRRGKKFQKEGECAFSSRTFESNLGQSLRFVPYDLFSYAEARETRFDQIASRNPKNVSNVTLYIIPRRFIECGIEVNWAQKWVEKRIVHFYTLRINKCFITQQSSFLRSRNIVGISVRNGFTYFVNTKYKTGRSLIFILPYINRTPFDLQ